MQWTLILLRQSGIFGEVTDCMSEPQSLQKYLEQHRCEPNPSWQPCAFYIPDGDQLEVYWNSAEAYGEETSNHKMCLQRSMKTKEIVGVKVYGIRKLVEELKKEPG